MCVHPSLFGLAKAAAFNLPMLKFHHPLGGPEMPEGLIIDEANYCSSRSARNYHAVAKVPDIDLNI